MDEGTRITDLADVPDDTTFLFTVHDVEAAEKEAILVRLDDVVTGWLNYCQHYTHIKLDKGSGAELRDDEIVCTNHAAYFESDTGLCTFGPCEGAYLNELDVTVVDDGVYLTDDDFTFHEVGPVESEAWDLESRSNMKF